MVAHPDHLEHFINADTKIVAMGAMDPLGFGPLSMMFSDGGKLTVHTKSNFIKTASKIARLKKNGAKFKVILGGPGSWQLTYRPDLIQNLKIDHIITGDADHAASSLFEKVESGEANQLLMPNGPATTESIPLISKPSMHGLVEVMRGCGRMCQYCEPTMRSAQYVPIESILNEVKVNAKNGDSTCLIHSEDIFLYNLEDTKNFMPNEDAILELFNAVMSVDGISSCNITHGTVSGVVANPELIRKLSTILNAGPNNYVKLLCGLETGSVNMMRKYMPLKAKPFKPEEWPDIICEGTAIMNENYWFPLYTIITGMPGEEEEDVWDTLRLIDRLEKELTNKVGEKAHFVVTPLSFIPLGTLKKSGFFNISEGMTEARALLLYRCWLHTFKEVTHAPSSLVNGNPILKEILKKSLTFGTKIAAKLMERWVRKLGYDPNKAFNLPRIKN